MKEVACSGSPFDMAGVCLGPEIVDLYTVHTVAWMASQQAALVKRQRD